MCLNCKAHLLPSYQWRNLPRMAHQQRYDLHHLFRPPEGLLKRYFRQSQKHNYSVSTHLLRRSVENHF